MGVGRLHDGRPIPRQSEIILLQYRIRKLPFLPGPELSTLALSAQATIAGTNFSVLPPRRTHETRQAKELNRAERHATAVERTGIPAETRRG